MGRRLWLWIGGAAAALAIAFFGLLLLRTGGPYVIDCPAPVRVGDVHREVTAAEDARAILEQHFADEGTLPQQSRVSERKGWLGSEWSAVMYGDRGAFFAMVDSRGRIYRGSFCD